MNGSELQRLARTRADDLPAAHPDRPFGPEWEVYRVRRKIFMLLTDVTGEPIVILKANPHDAEALREAYADITPGYHMNKKHWITLRPGGSIDRGLVADLVAESYLLVVETLPRAQRPVDPTRFERG